MRRAVVTGLGLVTPLASGVDETWERLISGESGAGSIQKFDTSDLSCRIACEVPRGEGAGLFNVDDYVTAKDQRKVDQFIVFGMAAAQQAVEDADWMPTDEESLIRTGVLLGSGIGGLESIESSAITVHERGARRVSPFFIPSALINLLSGHVSIKFGFRGPNHAVVTACAAGAHAIGDAARIIAIGDADVMVAGGAEAAICRLGMAGFAASRALSTAFNDEPTKASRPWDKARDGFVMGEGAGAVVVEELEHAKSRGAKIYGEIKGYGMSGDAHHITAPAADGDGGFRAMKAALERAKTNVEDIDYINAHGTSTPLGDEIELGAVKRVFGDAANDLSMSSTKSSTGHLLGAAGAVEAIFCLLAMMHGVIPPTLNLDDPSEGCDLDLVAHEAKQRPVRSVLSNSFGFGGTNASLVLTQAALE